MELKMEFKWNYTGRSRAGPCNLYKLQGFKYLYLDPRPDYTALDVSNVPYLRLIDFVYHSTLGLRVIKKKKKFTREWASSGGSTQWASGSYTVSKISSRSFILIPQIYVRRGAISEIKSLPGVESTNKLST